MWFSVLVVVSTFLLIVMEHVRYNDEFAATTALYVHGICVKTLQNFCRGARTPLYQCQYGSDTGTAAVGQ